MSFSEIALALANAYPHGLHVRGDSGELNRLITFNEVDSRTNSPFLDSRTTRIARHYANQTRIVNDGEILQHVVHDLIGLNKH